MYTYVIEPVNQTSLLRLLLLQELLLGDSKYTSTITLYRAAGTCASLAFKLVSRVDVKLIKLLIDCSSKLVE